MKKRIFTFLLTLTLLLPLLFACGGNTSGETSNGYTPANADNTPANVPHGQTPEEITEELAVEPVEDIIKRISKPLNFGEKIELDYAEFTLSSIEWLDELRPTLKTGVYSYYSDKEGEKYLVIRGTWKNTSGSEQPIRNIGGRFVFADKFNYDGAVMYEDENGFQDGYGDKIAPLKEVLMLIFVSVPDEIQEQHGTGQLTFWFNNELKYYNFYGFYDPKYFDSTDDINSYNWYNVNFNSDIITVVSEPETINEEIKLEQIVENETISFSFQKWSWQKKLVPPNPGRIYRSSTAKDGQTYFALYGTVKNIYTENISVGNDYMKVKFIFDEKYEYSGNVLAEKIDGSDFESFRVVVAPLTSTNFYIIGSVPDELLESWKTLEIQIGMRVGLKDTSFAKEFDYNYTLNFVNGN